MKLTILGTGTFFVDTIRTASAFILEIADKKMLIDCGPGTLVKLAQAGIKLTDLDYVFISHFHPDHTSDLFPLFMNYKLNDFFCPGSIVKFPQFFGPEGIDKFLSDYSHNSELLAYDGWGKIKTTEYQPLLEFDDFVFRSFKVKHTAFNFPARAYALRFEAEGKTVVFSGDTADCQGIRDACKGADLFVCDASSPKNKTSQAHLDTYDIGSISQEGQVKKVILTHFYPQFDNVDLVSEVKEKYSGEVSRAKDLTTIDL